MNEGVCVGRGGCQRGLHVCGGRYYSSSSVKSSMVLYDEARKRIDECVGADCDQCDASSPSSVNGCGANPKLTRCSQPAVLCNVPSENVMNTFFKVSDVKACFDSLSVDSINAKKTKEVMQNYLSMYS